MNALPDLLSVLETGGRQETRAAGNCGGSSVIRVDVSLDGIDIVRVHPGDQGLRGFRGISVLLPVRTDNPGNLRCAPPSTIVA
jgi:hypothetical protein